MYTYPWNQSIQHMTSAKLHFRCDVRVAWLRMKVTPHIKKLQPNSKTKKEEARMNEQNVRHLYCNQHNQITCNTDFDKLCRRICADFVSVGVIKLPVLMVKCFRRIAAIHSIPTFQPASIWFTLYTQKIVIWKRTMKLALRIEAKKDVIKEYAIMSLFNVSSVQQENSSADALAVIVPLCWWTTYYILYTLSTLS